MSDDNKISTVECDVASLKSKVEQLRKDVDAQAKASGVLTELITEIRVMNNNIEHIVTSNEKMEKAQIKADERMDKIEKKLSQTSDVMKDIAINKAQEVKKISEEKIKELENKLSEIENAPAKRLMQDKENLKRQVVKQIVSAIVGGLITLVTTFIAMIIAFA